MQQERSPFELLREKSIIAILDGDTDFGEIQPVDASSNIKVSMPYLSGPVLCDISNKFGLPAEYGWGGGAQSRWAYLDDLLSFCVEQNRMSDLLGFLFSKGQFVEKLKGHTPEVIESSYSKIIDAILGQINGCLYFGGHELTKVADRFVINKISAAVTVAAPALKVIDRDYIIKLSERAMQDVVEGNYDSAITKSRTLLEEVFCYVIEKKDEIPIENGDIGKLYTQVKELYHMHHDKDLDKRINGLLSGLEKILSSIAEMRNKGSDSHGLGSKRIAISEHHARLFVNSAMTMADFVLAVGSRDL